MLYHISRSTLLVSRLFATAFFFLFSCGCGQDSSSNCGGAASSSLPATSSMDMQNATLRSVIGGDGCWSLVFQGALAISHASESLHLCTWGQTNSVNLQGSSLIKLPASVAFVLSGTDLSIEWRELAQRYCVVEHQKPWPSHPPPHHATFFALPKYPSMPFLHSLT